MITILSIAVHAKGTNPHFDESCTHISIQDDGGGSYLQFNQYPDDAKINEIKFDFAEFDEIVKAVNLLKQNFDHKP